MAKKKKKRSNRFLFYYNRNFGKYTKDHLYANDHHNPQKLTTAVTTESQSKAIVPSVIWNSNQIRKTLHGVEQVAGIMYTVPVLRNGQKFEVREKYNVFTGEYDILAVDLRCNSMYIFFPRAQLIMTFLFAFRIYSRAPWEKKQLNLDNLDLPSLVSQGRVNEEGYVNVSRQLGICPLRGMYI